jgi:Trk K+ transport system NAD-binding subunit
MVDYLEVESEKAGALRLEELLVEGASELVGRSLADTFEEGSCLVLRRASGDTFTNPDSATKIEADDLLILLADPVVKEGAR